MPAGEVERVWCCNPSCSYSATARSKEAATAASLEHWQLVHVGLVPRPPAKRSESEVTND